MAYPLIHSRACRSGVVREYVGRVLEEAQNRPVFVVDELFGAGGAPMLGWLS